MNLSVKIKSKPSKNDLICIVGNLFPEGLDKDIPQKEKDYLLSSPAEWESQRFVRIDDTTYTHIPAPTKGENTNEYYRGKGSQLWSFMKSQNHDSVYFASGSGEAVIAIAEGLALRDYRFELYKKDKNPFEVKQVGIQKNICAQADIDTLVALISGIYFARDLVNEPANILTAEEMAHRFKKAGEIAGYKVDILGKAKIKSLKMGGLLSVNQGSTKDPTFSIFEYKPQKAKNKKPIVLVGKGIVYDTGGQSLKPTLNSMDVMKSDMGGGAAVAGTIYAAAMAQLPVHIIGLVPATDNQPGPDAYCPGDVITMMDGTTVEVMNTDAEGRLVLADALAYAKKYDPELTIDLATLTGSAMRALSYFAAAMMGTADEGVISKIKQAGFDSWERVVELPLWDDYGKDLKSDIADVKNIGASPLAGVILAGKFLERFTSYPWIHLDIAGPSFLPAQDGYLPKGGTGYGVNLLFHFLKNYNS